MKFASAILVLASEEQADELASALQKAISDEELRQFVLWLPFILDNLWHPPRGENGLIAIASPPETTSMEDCGRANEAFGWRPTTLTGDQSMIDHVNAIIARDRAETVEARTHLRNQQERVEPLACVRRALERLKSYGGPIDSAASAEADWVDRLLELNSALGAADLLGLLNQLPKRGRARTFILGLLTMIGTGDREQAVEKLKSVEPRGKLDAELAAELNYRLYDDLSQLLHNQQVALLQETGIRAAPDRLESVGSSVSLPEPSAPVHKTPRTRKGRNRKKGESSNESILVKPGGFVYRRKEHRLAGKPLAILKEFVATKDRVLTAATLQNTVWNDSVIGLDNVRSHIATLRAALRKALKVEGRGAKKDPLPCIDRGRDLAWKLDML
jgi:hypothetical protein